MCLHPVTIKNPLYLRSQYAIEGEDFITIPNYLKPNTEFIDVPCCTCAECRNTYYTSILQRGICESLTSYLFFVTLTYDNNHLPSLVLPNGTTIYYSDYSHIQNMFKRLRNKDVLKREFRYLVCLEYGDSNSRPHAHIILFVAKHSNDTKHTPYFLERLLFDNLKKYYAVNIGTRKNPIYEPLFTYRYRYTSSGLKTNYFVKYVEPNLPDYANTLTDNTTYIKTLSYLLSYVNKGSNFDTIILDYIHSINDPILKTKLKRLLSSKVRYSKGFGLGFYNHYKCHQERTFIKSNLSNIIYSTFQFPSNFDEYLTHINATPMQVEDFINNYYYKYKSLRDLLSDIGDKQLYIHYGIIHYFPHYFTLIYSRYYRHSKCYAYISYYFYFLSPYKYVKTKLVYSIIFDSPVSRYIRYCVTSGINAKIPFISFILSSNQKFVPLCKFYKERFTFLQDYIDMFKVCGFVDYEHWVNSFTKYMNTKVLSKSSGNKLLRANEQVNCTSYDPYTDLYNLIFTSVK